MYGGNRFPAVSCKQNEPEQKEINRCKSKALTVYGILYHSKGFNGKQDFVSVTLVLQTCALKFVSVSLDL